jgi:hypothetical protein
VNLLKPRGKDGFGWPEAIALAVYCLFLAWGIAHHQSWLDEAQAWLEARSCSLLDLLVHRVRYDGAPGFWHTLLWIESRLHVSFLGMRYIAGLFAALGVYIWLRFNPLPRIISLLLPFSFFFQYQYAVIARMYVLLPLLAFALMALYQNKKSNPWLFCIVAGILANSSLHMFAFAAGAVVAYGLDRWQLSRQNRSPIEFRKLAAPALLLLVFFGLSIATAWPTPDGDFGGQNVEMIRGNIPLLAQSSAQQGNSPSAAANQNTEFHGRGRIAQIIWHTLYSGKDPGAGALLVRTILQRIGFVMIAATAPISTSNVLAMLFLFILVLTLRSENLLIFLLPWAFVLFATFAVHGASHHSGIAWVALVCSLWALSLRPWHSGAERLRTSLYAVTLLIVAIQIGWSAHCLYAEVHTPYAPDEATAKYLAQLPLGTRIAAFDFFSVTANAWLPHSPYFNHRFDYWPFSKSQDPNFDALDTRPDIVVLQEEIWDAPANNQWIVVDAPGAVKPAVPRLVYWVNANGYRETHRFCGQHLFRNASEYTECRLIYETGPAADAAKQLVPLAAPPNDEEAYSLAMH